MDEGELSQTFEDKLNDITIRVESVVLTLRVVS